MLGQQIKHYHRTLFVGSDGVVITGRSMDWMEDLHSDLWAFPQDMTRNGAAGPQSITWTSKEIQRSSNTSTATLLSITANNI
jgi:hypothetical protein